MTPNKPMTKDLIKETILRLCTKKYNKEKKTIDLSIEGNQLEEIVTNIALLRQQEQPQSQPMSEDIKNTILNVESGLPFITGVLLKEDIEKLVELVKSSRLALPQKEKG